MCASSGEEQLSDEDSEDESPTSRILDQDALRSRDRDRTRLPAETVLAERYRIVRFISQGGMGAVYEAEDLQLRERVALKTVRAPVAAQPGGLARFKREIQLARKVTHPNVCRIFEFGIHPLSAGQVAFLTMELLEGETLADRIKREGALAPAVALSIGRQLAAALAAAHEAGVIHRDLKASNVMLSTGPHGEPRAVVSDFGLAQGPAPADVAADAPEDVVGTLAYMAPEQMRGEITTAAADVYALGVLFHEMVTGVKPFSTGSVVTAAVERQMGPPSLRRLAPGLDPLWETVIQRCLQPEPTARFANATDLARALEGPRKPWLARPLLAAGAAAAVITALWFGLPQRGGPQGSPTSESSGSLVRPRPAVAVLGFKNLSGRPEIAWLSTALSEMFTTELASGGQLRSIAGETVSRGRIELSLPDADSLAPETLKRVRANLGADIVILGSYLGVLQGPILQFRLDVRAQDATSGEIVSSFSETGSDAQLFSVVSRAGAQLRRALGAAPLSSSQTAEARSTVAQNPEAQRLYAEGLTRLRSFDALGAVERLTAAVAADGNFPLAHSTLSEALSLLGHEQRAGQEARIAFDRSNGLGREERLIIEARYRETTRERDKVAEIWRVLFGFFPDSLEHGLNLALALNAAGKPKDALETLGALRQLPGSTGRDPRIDIAEGTIAQSLGDYQRQRDAAQRAAALGRQANARLLIARARELQAYASGRLGLEDEAKAAALEARDLFSAAGDSGGAAWALNREGNIFYQQGQLVEALRVYREAHEILEKIGYRGNLTALSNNISEVLVLQGDLVGAQRMLERARGFTADTRDPRASTIVLLNLTNVAAERGEFTASTEAYEKAIQECRKLGDQSLTASAIRHRADMLANLGDLAAARAGYEQAADIHGKQSNLRYVAFALFGLGQIQREQGSSTDARRSQEQALALREQLRDKIGIAESRLALAQLVLDAGNSTEADSLLRAALPTLIAERMGDREAEAQALTAEVLFRRGRSAEARDPLRRASTLAAKTTRPGVRMRVALAVARFEGIDADEARRRAQTALDEAKRLNYGGLELEGSLVLGQLEVAAGSVDQGRKRLEALERDARRRGFSRIATAATAGLAVR